MIEVPVYIPNPDADERDTLFAKQLVEHSAIVGLPGVNPGPASYVTVYYEGNKYGAQNMVTFADRAMFAFWRMRDHYPTVATAAIKRRALLRVAKLYPEHGRVEPLDSRGLYQLGEWLGVPLEESERLALELRCSGVRV